MSPRVRKKPRPAWTAGVLTFAPAVGDVAVLAAETGEEDADDVEDDVAEPAEETGEQHGVKKRPASSDDIKEAFFYGFDKETQACWRCTAKNPQKELAKELVWPTGRSGGEPAQAVFADGASHDIPDILCDDIAIVRRSFGGAAGAGSGIFEAEHVVTRSVKQHC